MPKLELIEIEDYEEMLEMASNRRQRYYNYLWATKTKANHEDVKLFYNVRNTCSVF